MTIAQNAQWQEFITNLRNSVPTLDADPLLPGAVELKRDLWSSRFLTEDQKIAQLESWCIRVTGDKARGMKLAQRAIWS